MEKIIPNVKIEDPVAIWICFGDGHNSATKTSAALCRYWGMVGGKDKGKGMTRTAQGEGTEQMQEEVDLREVTA